MTFDPKQLRKPSSRVEKGKQGYAYKRTLITVWEMPVKGVPYRFLTVGRNHLPEEEIQGMLRYFGFDPAREITADSRGSFDQYLQEIKQGRKR